MIGATLAQSGLGLVTGNAPGVDLWVARAFCAALKHLGHGENEFLCQITTSFFKRGSLLPIRGFNAQLDSRIHVASYEEWIDEAVTRSDATIMIGGHGHKGALTIARRFMQRGKPVFPVPFTGGRSDEVFQDILRTWHESPVPGLTRNHFLSLALPWISGTGTLGNLLHGALAETPDIFISYRRTDASAAAGRLHRDLCEHFGEKRVFLDIRGIAPSEAWEQAIEHAITGCKVGIVVIGPHWMKTAVASNAPSGRPIDYVTLEITKLLNSGKAIAPILVEGASLPENSELPAELAPLTRFQAPVLNNANWDIVVGELIAQLERIVGTGIGATC